MRRILAIDHGVSFDARLTNWVESPHNRRTAKEAIVRTLQPYCDGVLVDSLEEGRYLGSIIERRGGVRVLGLPDITLTSRTRLDEYHDCFEHELRQGASVFDFKIEVQMDSTCQVEWIEDLLVWLNATLREARTILFEPIAASREMLKESLWEQTLDLLAAEQSIMAKIRPWLAGRPGLDESQVSRLRSDGWVLASTGLSWPDFQDTLVDARSYGCAGYAAGSAIWGDQVFESRGPESLRRLLVEESVSRMNVLSDICDSWSVIS